MVLTQLELALDALDHVLIPVGAVVERAAHAGDRGGGGTRGLLDGVVVLPGGQHAGYGEALGHVLDLSHGAEVLQERVHLGGVFDGEDRLDEGFHL
jgi:hypothetical protein